MVGLASVSTGTEVIQKTKCTEDGDTVRRLIRAVGSKRRKPQLAEPRIGGFVPTPPPGSSSSSNEPPVSPRSGVLHAGWFLYNFCAWSS